MEDYIRYGDVVRFINGYQGGSYLGAGAGSTIAGAVDDVGTYSSINGYDTVTQWVIFSLGGAKDNGNIIRSCDRVAILAIKNEASLALFGNTFLPNGDFGVATGNGSAVWHILIDSNANDNPGLVAGDRLHLLNDFNNGTGFLDTRNHASPGSGFLFNVSGSYFYNRDTGSGTWQVVRA
ncbi:hypothetical protein [Burkholderia ubonensis]|uniref:hypothetical protein n=1 Tax=Burkholderia ubonensis TaxID=101571 RepID=UPI000B23686E|nr:hypothetical protein [Burkholderia ubonensis]